MSQTTCRMARKQKNSTDRILSVSAIAIGIFTFLVYVYQSTIMTEQKHTSVWPYIEWIRSYNETEGFYLTVNNKGIGPAKVAEEKIWLADTLVNNISTESFIEIFFPNEPVDYSYSTVSGRVLAPGESIRRIQVYSLSHSLRFDSLLRANRFRYELIYCSVYDDCWMSSGLTVTPVD